MSNNHTAGRRPVFVLVAVSLILALAIAGVVAFKSASKLEIQFIVSGDVQYNLRDRDYEIWGAFLREACEQNPTADFALLLGDMVENPAEERDWEAFFENKQRAFGKLDVYPTPGNHETSITQDIYLQKFGLPDNGPVTTNQGGTISSGEFYSFDYKDCHVLSLNSCFFMKERLKAGSEEEYEADRAEINTWIEKDLANSEAAFKVVIMHHPMYPIAADDEIYERLRNNWESIFNRYGVDLVLCGHQHAYARTDAAEEGQVEGPVYVMVNSGQKRSKYLKEEAEIPEYIKAFREDVPVYLCVKLFSGEKKTKIKVEAVAPGGETVDSFEIVKEQ